MKVRTLQEITGKRPKCQVCQKPLKPDTSWFAVDGHFPEPPTLEQIEAYIADGNTDRHRRFMTQHALSYGYRPDRVHQIILGQTYDGKPKTEIRFWTGQYEGHGRGKGRGEPLFCNIEHALAFAAACWNSGMRIIEKGG